MMEKVSKLGLGSKFWSAAGKSGKRMGAGLRVTVI